MSPRLWRAFDGLAARVAGTLALALLPIGALAVLQAIEISRDGERRMESALLSATAEAAAGEALAVANASGTAGTLAAHMSGFGGAHLGCSEIFENVVEVTRQYSFAAYVDADGILRCGSGRIGADLTGGVVHPRMVDEKQQIVTANLEGPLSGSSVIVVATPVFSEEAYVGYVFVSVPHWRIPELQHESTLGATETGIVTFNVDGLALSSSEGFDDIDRILPDGVALKEIVSPRQSTFAAKSRVGEPRNFALVPIIPGVVYALGSQPRAVAETLPISTILFPALMMVAGLIAAFQAVHFLVIRHIRGLMRNMDEFSRSRRINKLPYKGQVGREIAEIETAWTELAEDLLRDEAELENMIHEKNVLLKEVHHRVKNNLQLIASIVSLKMRRASTEEARRSLREVQGRVRSIAAVHQSLYSSPTTGRVQADELLREVLDGIIEAGATSERRVEVSRHYDPVWLYPDQAVPFLLLATEAVTNALKYMGRAADGAAYLRIALDAISDEKAVFQVANSCGTPFFPVEQVKGSGLGRSLISGFAAQVGGRVTVEDTEEVYAFAFEFEPATFDPEARDVSVADIEGDASSRHD